jgi:oligosaccharide repeat unit polymerase
MWSLALFLVFTMWLLWVGNRGAALLYWAALAYTHHVSIRRIAFRKYIVAALVAILVISPIREIRNVPANARAQAIHHIGYNPLNGLSELGLTFRPYLVFVRYRAEGRSLGFNPYHSAIEHIVPNLGEVRSAQRRPLGYRSSVWVSYVIDPVSANLGIGVGGSAIGEPYALFGLGGVIVMFVLLGLVITHLEVRAVVQRSPAALALIILVFYPINWYVRDDAYGLVRPLVWGLLAVGCVKFILMFGQLTRTRSQPGLRRIPPVPARRAPTASR